MIAPLLFLMLIDSPDARVPLRDGCSAGDEQLTLVTSADRVEVRQAIAGGDGTCYQVHVIRDGNEISGYVLGEALPAVAKFVAERERISSERMEAMARQQAAQAATEAAASKAALAKTEPKEIAPKPSAPEFLGDFVARDVENRPHHLSSLPGRLIVVTFWSGRSKGALNDVQAIYTQYKKRGVSAVGINMDGVKMLAKETDDIDLLFPQWADPGGIAQRYGVDRTGKTFVLDRSFRVLAAGSGGDAMRVVKQIMSGKQPSTE